jgi:hypothetical protein
VVAATLSANNFDAGVMLYKISKDGISFEQ